ncbi:MAG: ferritin family protein [Candidatus Aminicenantales bacterium]
MNVMAVLEKAIELEEKIRSCYELLGKVTEDGVAAELRELAREEKSHANVLKTGKGFVIRTPDLFGQETVSVSRIRLGLKALTALEENLKDRKTGFREGLERLYRLEKEFERVHMNTAVEFKDYSLKKLFEALARADAEHRQRLERLIARL